jgi:hypothetical protein
MYHTLSLLSVIIIILIFLVKDVRDEKRRVQCVEHSLCETSSNPTITGKKEQVFNLYLHPMGDISTVFLCNSMGVDPTSPIQ